MGVYTARPRCDRVLEIDHTNIVEVCAKYPFDKVSPCSINWKDLSNDYGGVIIRYHDIRNKWLCPPEDPEAYIRRREYAWVFGFDCDTMVVWSADAVDEFECVGSFSDWWSSPSDDDEK